MYWSAAVFGLVTLLTVALTLTVSATCAGEVTVHVASTAGLATYQEVQLTDLVARAMKL